MRTRYADMHVFNTKDGSQIRELMHPKSHANHNQSLAEAKVLPGQTTTMHRHAISEEIYHLTQGEGLMTLGNQQFQVKAGDTVCIPPGTAHCIKNTSQIDLRILCCCAPAYSHKDTELLD